jgi:hypothetical protein
MKLVAGRKGQEYNQRKARKGALDIAQAFSVGQLGKSHTRELIVAGKRTDAIIALVTINASTKLFDG